MWVAWVRGLAGSYFYLGCLGYVGQNIFYVGQHVTWVMNLTWVTWIKYIFAWAKIFCEGQFFYVVQQLLREFKVFARV